MLTISVSIPPAKKSFSKLKLIKYYLDQQCLNKD